MSTANSITHEQYIKAIADHVIRTAPEADRERISKARIMYGAGYGTGARGITFYGAWSAVDGNAVDMVELCAFGQSDAVQIAGTVIHELAHVAAGVGTGHGKDWKAACERIGLRLPKAAGMKYQRANLRPDIRALLDRITPTDGAPVSAATLAAQAGTKAPKARACPMGVGVRGGKSRGTGSGSRMRKYTCQCAKPVIIRCASDTLAAHCDHCRAPFALS